MKRTVTLFGALLLALFLPLTAFAADGRVIYDGNAMEYVFEPGSDDSPTDLFPDFKGVMPGDQLTERVTVKSQLKDKTKVKIYLRSLGARDDSKAFLSQLGLKVKKSDENDMAYMFDAAADDAAQLSDWVYLGTLYAGGEVNLDVILSVPASMGNEFQDQVGVLEWEFKIEEFPSEPDDPTPPPMGDDFRLGLFLALSGASLLMIFIILWALRKKNGKQEKPAASN